jgi:hypothetical protein
MSTIHQFLVNVSRGEDLPRVVDQQSFLKAAKIVHKNNYNYSEVIYKNAKTQVVIICGTHGKFSQIPSKHINGQGCRKCGIIRRNNLRRKSLTEFIDAANKKHLNKYDYSKVIYVNYHKHVIIICKEHGEFLQTPSNHLNGHGCSDCSGNKQKTTEQFIEEANAVHKCLYTYGKTNYIQANSKVIITCTIHGDFEQTPHHHLNRGDGCPNCAFNVPYTTESFITASNNLHNNYYLYTKVIYAGICNNVIITCPVHGDFDQQAHSHLSGYGCKHCGHIRSGLARRTPQEDWIIMASNKHNNMYNYEKVKYIKGTIPVIIVCPIHGEFEKTPDLHLAGSGCFKCRPQYSKGQIAYMEYLRVERRDIQHALNGGEKLIADSRYKADGYCPIMNEIIEFHGCLWHGCPKCFSPSDINPKTKRTFAEELQRTRDKEAFIRMNGFNYHEIWECDWKRAIKTVNMLKRQWKTAR